MFNIEKMLREQEKLDNLILKKCNILNFEAVQNKVALALLVEVSELANEVQSFKYWKLSKQIDLAKVKEEYSDGIHFLNSISFYYQLSNLIPFKVISPDINEQFRAVFISIAEFMKKPSKESILEVYSLYLGIAKLLNISNEEIEKSYFEKNLINQKRAKGSY
ncbi:unknown; predicted coding region [Mycoplasmopsis pulmonis]|uniref:dUTPase n=1 Tax=Mycoplasmopsis pulmonis (strain UAB CTIP) TaxID=272635 RepID=Q98QA9_MYCPU|nr:dUTP diphosphatase [Mycoplasmopsis pulmonis]MDZ7293533.1 dUTP diphosphatase [Mycoplasmopsis pulmonis]CAC13630.1 unknown; predicted coding region [Mycoplasmopsis pulmonis]VEU68221.1 Uncharacterized protein conserved in bacteria [Mycoplasmopsis pulmonis]